MMNKELTKKTIEYLLDVFLNAGKISIDLREKGLIKEYKSDNTPVTNGDLEVNKILTSEINKITPNIPIVSEESSKNKKNEKLKNFWLIDPIDGTYDYINGKDEFTLNAGLIIDKKPFAGIIYAPAKKRLFFSTGYNESFEVINGKNKKLNCEKKTKKGVIKAVSYSEKLKSEIKEHHKKFGVTEYKRMKSSLKFCVIAAGEYDLYVAEARACEWDISAGHAILLNSGGIITDFEQNEILYGKKDFKNPSLILKRSSVLYE